MTAQKLQQTIDALEALKFHLDAEGAAAVVSMEDDSDFERKADYLEKITLGKQQEVNKVIGHLIEWKNKLTAA